MSSPPDRKESRIKYLGRGGGRVYWLPPLPLTTTCRTTLGVSDMAIMRAARRWGRKRWGGVVSDSSMRVKWLRAWFRLDLQGRGYRMDSGAYAGCCGWVSEWAGGPGGRYVREGGGLGHETEKETRAPTGSVSAGPAREGLGMDGGLMQCRGWASERAGGLEAGTREERGAVWRAGNWKPSP